MGQNGGELLLVLAADLRGQIKVAEKKTKL